jgi:ammonium transporter
MLDILRTLLYLTPKGVGMRQKTLLGIAAVGLAGVASAEGINGADTAWMLVSTALVLGGLSALPSYFFLLYRPRTRLDDSLDVFGAHGLAGITGALLTGILAEKAWNGVADGLLFGNPGQLFVQAVAVAIAILYSALGTFLLLKLVGLFTPLRATPKEEGAGLDVAQHGEEAYASGEGAILVLSEGLPPAPKPAGGKA